MDYLERVLSRNKSTGTGRRSSVADIMELIKTKKAAAPLVAPVGNNPLQAAAGRALAGGGSESDMLWNRLNKMIAESPFKNQLTPGSRSRSYEEQVRLYNRYKAGKGPQAAKPGTSKHGNGRANDFKYGSDQARAWVLANLSRYGLAAPIYNPKLPRHLDESWHIELGR